MYFQHSGHSEYIEEKKYFLIPKLMTGIMYYTSYLETQSKSVKGEASPFTSTFLPSESRICVHGTAIVPIRIHLDIQTPNLLNAL